MQTATVYQEDSKLYLETFLIDNTVTKKNKKVNDSTLDNNVNASSKHPLTLYQKSVDGKWIWDHPVIETNSLTQNIEFQKQYEIGHSVKLKKVSDGCWNAVYEITNPGAANLLKQYLGKQIPFYTSSGIIHSSKENPLDIKDWRIIHNAIVSEPANGFEKAQIVDMCSGTQSACQTLLTASVSSVSTLSDYLSSLASNTGNFPHYTMSSENSNQPTTAVSGANIQYNPGFSNNTATTGMGSIPASLTPDSNIKPENQQVKTEVEKTEDKTDYKTRVKELEDQLKTLKTESETKDNEHKTVTERLASLERENIRNTRKNQVLGIVAQYPEAFLKMDGQPDQDVYSKTVLEWIDKNYDDSTVTQLLEARQLKWVNAVQNQNHKPSATYGSMTADNKSNYQTTQMTTASTTADSSLPIWEKVYDLTNARIRLFADKYQRGGSY